MASGELLNMVIHRRAALLQLYLIFSMRYRGLSEKYANPTLSTNLHDALASDDSEIVYSAETSLFESSRLAHRMHFISREQAQLVSSDALLPETGLPIDTLLGSRRDPCQRPPPPRQPPPLMAGGCSRCLCRHASRGCSSNGRGGGWGRVTHSRSCGDGDIRGGGLGFNVPPGERTGAAAAATVSMAAAEVGTETSEVAAPPRPQLPRPRTRRRCAAAPTSERQLKSGSAHRLPWGRPETHSSRHCCRPRRLDRRDASRRLAAEAARRPPHAHTATARASLRHWVVCSASS